MIEGAHGVRSQMAFTITIDPPVNNPIYFDWRTSDDSGDNAASAGTDYDATTQTGERISANTSSHRITVPIIGDNDPEFDETFTVTLSNVSGAALVTASAQGTITNDDGSLLTIESEAIDEGVDGANTTMTFTVTATPPATSSFSVEWTASIEDGVDEAIIGTDFNSANGRLDFANTDAMKTFTVTIRGDNTPEPDETFTVTLSNATTGGQIEGNGTAKGTITNDDGSGLSIADMSLVEGNGGTTQMMFRVSVIPPSSSPITYSWATSNNAGGNAATAGTDYTATTRSNVNIVANTPFDTISVPIRGDNTPEPDETFTVTLSNVSGGSLIKATAQGTITNDDGSTLSIASVDQAEGTSADTTMTFTITSSPPATTGFTVQWGTSIDQGDEATAGTDFTTASGTAVFNVGDDEQTFMVSITGDNMPEPNESFTVTLSNAGVGAQIAGNGTAKGTINNDDGHGIRIATSSVAEGANNEIPNMTFTVEVVPESATAITFDWTTSDDSTTNAAMAGTDYTASSDNDVRIPPNTASVPITVPITGDNDPELDETFTVTLSDVKGTNASLLVASAQGTILNDDGSTLSIAAVSQAEGTGSDTTMTFTITATPTPTSNFSVDWETSIAQDDNATPGTDFITASDTANFTSGDDMETFTVTIKADSIPEFDETFTVTLSSPGVGALVSSTNGSAKGEITNDDGHGIRIADVSRAEGATTNNMVFTIEAVPKSTTPITFNWTTANDDAGTNPATAGSDYTASNETGETISANSPSVSINVPILGDNNPEYDETFLVNLTNATSGVQILDNSAKGTILNDDGSTLTIAPVSQAEGTGSDTTMTFTITATPPAANQFRVNWATSIVDGVDKATADTDFMSASGTATFDKDDTTETFTVTIIGDNDPEINETFTVTLSNPTTGGQLSVNNSAQGTIENDDGSGLRIKAASKEEGAMGATNNTMAFTIEVVPRSSSPITFDWATSIVVGVDSATADTDYMTLNGNDINIPANTSSFTINVPITGDDTPESDETFTITLSDVSSGAKIIDATAKGTILNDDGSTLKIEPVSLAEGANGATSKMIFMVTASPPATSRFTVEWETDTGTGENPATEDVDYTSASGTLTFEETNSAKPIEISIRDDNIPEFNETFVVTLSNAGAGSQISGTKGSAQGTITNDDGHGIRIADVSMAEGSTTNNMMFTIEAVPQSSNQISFDWTTAADTSGTNPATAGSDFSTNMGTGVTITANTPSVTINVPIIGDTNSEYDETFVVNLSNAAGATILNSQATGTITNDDGTTLSIAPSKLAEGADTDRNVMRFTVTATPPTSTGFSVNWATSAGTGLHLATKNVDYSIVQNPLNFGAGVATQMIDATILGDNTPEFDETFNITLASATSGVKISTSNGSAQGTITNDDGIGLSVGSARKVEGNTGASQMEFTVSVIPTSSTPITYNWATSDDSGENVATAGTDYTASTQTGVMIAASAPSDTFSVPIIGDNAPEFDETFVVTISNPSSGVSIIESAGTAKGTITNDDGSELTIEPVAINEGTTDQTSKMRFTVTAAPPATTRFSVEWETGTGTGENLATEDVDYTPGSGTLTFAESDSEKTFEVDIKGDNTPEPDETFTVSLSNETSGAIISTTMGVAKGTITNDDGSELTIEDARLLEGGDGDKPKMIFTVTAKPPATTGFSVQWTTSDGTGTDIATADTDYTRANSTLNFAATDTTKAIEIEILGDDSSEEDETFAVTLSNPGNGARLSATKFSATGTIIDDDKFPFISIVADSGYASEGDGPAKFMLTGRGNVPTTPIRIKATPSEDDSDFLTDAVAGTEVEIPVTFTDPDGDKVYTGEFPVELDNDSNKEATGKIQLALKENSAVYLLGPESERVGKITIWDDDVPELTIVGGPAVTEGPDAKAIFTIVSNVMPPAAIPIQYTATSESYIANSGTKVTADPPISFVKFDTTGKFEGILEIAIIDDELREPEGTIQVTLNSEATLSTYYLDETNSSNLSASVTVTDDDPVPTVSVANLNPFVERNKNGNTSLTIPVTLSNPTTETVMIEWSTNTGSAIATDFEEQTNQTLEIASGTTGNIVITIKPGSNNELIENFTVVLSSARGANLASSITVNVSISDQALPNLEFTNPTFSVPEDGDEIIVTVGLTASAIVDVTFKYELIDGTATADDDYTVPSNLAGVIPEGSTSNSITIKIKDNAIVEDNESFIVRLKELNGAKFASGTTLDATVTIVDDDEPALSFRTTNFATNENVGIFEVEVQIANASDVKVTFNIALGGGTATNREDYTNPTSLQGEIAIGSTSTTISIPITDDEEEEENETFNLTLSNLVGAVFADSGSELIQEITIIDNDETPQVTIEATTQSPIMEGTTAVFTLSVTPVPETLNVRFNVTQESNFILWRYKRSISMNTAMATLEIKTHDDEVDDDTGDIIVTLVDTEDYDILAPPQNSASITVMDDDDPPADGTQPTAPEDRISVAQVVVNQLLDNPSFYQGTGSTESRAPSPVLPKISIDAIQTQINEGSSVEFIITSNGRSESYATLVNLNVNPIGDFFDIDEPTQISRSIQRQEYIRVIFPTIDDSIAEEDGRLEVSIIPDSSYQINSNKSASSVIISDASDRQLRQDLLVASSQAFLPDIIGNMAARTSGLIEQRIQQGFSKNSDVTLNLAGENTLKGLIEMSGELTNEGSVEWREVLGDSSFAMTLLSGDEFVAPATIWGIGDYRDLSASASNSSHSWSGEVFTGQFGIDALIGQNTLTGLSASITENDIKVGADNSEELAFTLNATTLNPYFGWTSPTQDTELRAVAGYGIGDFTIDQANYDFEILSSKSYSLALAGSKELYSSESILNGTTKLQLVGDSWFIRQNIDGKSELLSDLQTDAQFLRISTEATHQFELKRGSTFSPLLSTGIRRDQKDQQSLIGLELTSGFEYIDPIGLTLSSSSSMLVGRDSEIQKMNLRSSLRYDYGRDDLGLTFEISPTWGQTQSEVQNSLWSNNILTNDKEVGQYTIGTQISSEIGYGFTIGDDTSKLNLYSGYEFDASSNDELLIGTNLSIGSNLRLDFERINKIGSPDSATNNYQFNARLNW